MYKVAWLRVSACVKSYKIEKVTDLTPFEQKTLTLVGENLCINAQEL